MGCIYTQSFLLDCAGAVHDFATDVIKISLHGASASLTAATTAYGTTGEAASGSGYTTTGETLAVTSGYPQIVGGQSCVRFDDVTWTFGASKTVRYALIYNSSKSNKAIAVIDMGADRVVSGAFSIKFPLALDAFVRFVTAA